MIALGTRLRHINRVALVTAVGIVATIIVLGGFVMGLFALVEGSRSQARVLADNAAASLMFQDSKAANELLQSLRGAPNVASAALYATDGTLFAEYRRDSDVIPAQPIGFGRDIAIGLRALSLVEPVAFQKDVRGSLVVVVGLGSLYRQTLLQIASTLAAALLGLFASALLLRRLNGSVLRPLAALNELMDKVSDAADYSVRANPSDIVEMHALATGFNAMLEQIHQRDARNAAVLNAIPDLLFELDIDGRYIDYHSPHTELHALPSDALIGRTVADVLPPGAAKACMDALHAADKAGTSTGAQYELHQRGVSRWFELSVSRKTAQAGQARQFIVLSRDITERKEAETRIARLAYFDSLTGLPNRRAFMETVEHEVRRAQVRGSTFALLFMDLDGFKNVNDTLGHGAGDLILQWAANRLREGLHDGDTARLLGSASQRIEIARLGGDEFTLLIKDIDHPDVAAKIAEHVGSLMRRAFLIEGRRVTLSTSIGVAVFPEHGDDAATLLKHADTAMYHAKNSGRDNAQLYRASLTEHAMRHMELDTSLREALDRNEFHLVYQPQVDAVTGVTRSVEALIRWTHPTLGQISPLAFIPIAEENGTIERIGRWVLHTACADAAAWNAMGFRLSVAVNLSPVQFRDPGLLQAVVDVLEHTGLAPDLLELEVTEGALMEHSTMTIDTLHALNARGVRIALDDFGTGYSSLGYLTRMPISHLKIDRCFVNGLFDGGENGAIVRAVLAMARSLGMRVTAEGVETLAQVKALQSMACDRLQGFYFSHPVRASGVVSVLGTQWVMDHRGLDDPAGPTIGEATRAAIERLGGL